MCVCVYIYIYTRMIMMMMMVILLRNAGVKTCTQSSIEKMWGLLLVPVLARSTEKYVYHVAYRSFVPCCVIQSKDMEEKLCNTHTYVCVCMSIRTYIYIHTHTYIICRLKAIRHTHTHTSSRTHIYAIYGYSAYAHNCITAAQTRARCMCNQYMSHTKNKK
jgi:hypothetical protein